MSISISGSSYGQQGYSSINVNSKQYKAAAAEYLDAVNPDFFVMCLYGNNVTDKYVTEIKQI